MNRFLDRLAELYTPLRLRGLLMDGNYRFAPDTAATAPPKSSDAPCGSRFSGDPVATGQHPSPLKRLPQVRALQRIVTSFHR
jgi:hypothetical protein